MTAPFTIVAEWEQLDRGLPEERACFAAVGLSAHGRWLTEAEDTLVHRIRERVHVSAFRLAEWLAWNWWRLRWEPRTSATDWALSHCTASIGGGYVWPNISVMSDGRFVSLDAKPTNGTTSEPLRYLARFAAAVSADEWESTLDGFIEQVRGQLRAESVPTTNLDRIWTDVLMERHDTKLSDRRRLEAQLGFDPDEGDEALLARAMAEATWIGADTLGELAPLRSTTGDMPSVAALRDIAKATGFSSIPPDIQSGMLLDPLVTAQAPAWVLGTHLASRLRDTLGLDGLPLKDDRLSELAGISSSALHAGPQPVSPGALSFAWDETADRSHIVFRSNWHTGRRFELARMIGDRLAHTAASLRPSTRLDTYRQKTQRAFAAELLCPHEALRELLTGDVSTEAQDDAANHFDVSPLTVRTILVNHGDIPRDSLSDVQAA